MEEKTSTDVLLEHMPAFAVWYKALFTYLFQFFVFVLAMVFFWWISSTFLIGALLGQSLVSLLLVFHFIYMANNGDKIREKYRKKYGKLAFQYFWYYYQSHTIPVVSAAFYFPLLLKTDYFLPAIVSLPSHFITNSIFPYFIALPLGIFIIIIGLLIRRPSGGYGIDVDHYLYTMYPEKSKLITGGMYKYIRNPQYLCRGILAVGFGVLANNLLAIGIGLIHFLSYCAIIPAEDKELARRSGDVFREYQRRVPALLPRCGNWKKFVRFVFVVEKE